MTGAKWTNRQGDGSAPTGLGDGTQVRKRASAAKREERKKESYVNVKQMDVLHSLKAW